MKATREFDAVGAETALAYADSAGTEIAAFSNKLDVQSRVRIAESTSSKQTYTYDGRDRLTTVQDTTGGNCVTRQYGFSLDSNRTTLATSGPGTGGACTTSGAATATSAFDAADRITDSGYTYDALGRTRTVPAAHTDQPAGNELTVNFHANDMVAKLAQTVPNGAGGTIAKSKVLTLDPSDRVSKTTDSLDGIELRKTTNHYTSAGDSPSWIASESRPDASTGWSTTWSRNVTGPDGDLAIIQPSTGGAKLQIANLHGDIVATIGNGPFGGFSSWSETNEYGLKKNAAVTLGQNYGWLGTNQRSTDAVGGLTLMGARLYNPTTGRFLSRDPVPGGNDNAYIYPVDPINLLDIDGELGMPKFIAKNWRKATKIAIGAAAIAGGVACGVSVVCAIDVGAAAGAASYAASNAGTKKFKVAGMAKAAAKGALLGAVESRMGGQANRIIDKPKHVGSAKPFPRRASAPKRKAPVKTRHGWYGG